MRPGVLLVCGIILALCVLLLLHHRPMPAEISAPTVQSGIPETSVNKPMVSHSNLNDVIASVTNTSAVTRTVVSTPTEPTTNTVDPGLLATWQSPIAFYGKVEDTESNSIAGVNIHFRWSEVPTENGMRTADTVSDSSGLFSLQGKHGRSLTVSFGKDGYHSLEHGEQTFLYALGPNIITPDASHPVIFHLQKAGTPEPLMRLASSLTGPRRYHLDANGSPTDISFYTGKRVAAEHAQFHVEYSMSKPGAKSSPFPHMALHRECTRWRP